MTVLGNWFQRWFWPNTVYRIIKPNISFVIPGIYFIGVNSPCTLNSNVYSGICNVAGACSDLPGSSDISSIGNKITSWLLTISYGVYNVLWIIIGLAVLVLIIGCSNSVYNYIKFSSRGNRRTKIYGSGNQLA